MDSQLVVTQNLVQKEVHHRVHMLHQDTILLQSHNTLQDHQQLWHTGAKIPVAIKMLGRNCGLWTEDDLLLEPEGLGGAVVGDSCCPAPSASSMPTSRSVLTAKTPFPCLTFAAGDGWDVAPGAELVLAPLLGSSSWPCSYLLQLDTMWSNTSHGKLLGLVPS